MDTAHQYRTDWNSPSDNQFSDEEPLSLMSHPPTLDNLGLRGKNCMALQTKDEQSNPENMEDTKDKNSMSFASLLGSIGPTDTFLQQGSVYAVQFLSCSQQRIYWFLALIVVLFYLFPLTCIILLGCLTVILVGGHQSGDTQSSTRTAKWTITSYSYQMRDGFLVSPPFLDKCGQWRMVIKQKRGMDGLQTSFGLMCTEIFPEIEVVTATVTFFCTNQMGQELAIGGMRNLKFQYQYKCPGDCDFSRHVRLPKKLMGQSETLTVHCSVEFRKKMVTFLRTLAQNLGSGAGNCEVDEGGQVKSRRKGKNVVLEHGEVFPGSLEFHEEDLPSPFRPVMRFVQHSETRTFVWEIPNFCSLLENSDLWGVYSPQFFINSHDSQGQIIAIWRMKLIEVQGVFRLHVQLRGLPRSTKQVKLWYLLQLVDMYGDSVIPEHAINRVKYPDHMNLWDTTRHILYRRETILERFVGGCNNGALTLRISIQMQPNDLPLMEVDSDEWIQRAHGGPGCDAGDTVEPAIPHGLLKIKNTNQREQKMLTN